MQDVPREAIERYLAEIDDQGDMKGSLQQFRDDFENESDVELERKRKIMRNRILANFPDPDKEAKLRILTEIIQHNVKRRADFEKAKEASRWQQALLTGAFTLLGALAGGWIAQPGK